MNIKFKELTREEYRDKVFGCWLGKNIGGTLGTPYEGRKELLTLKFYEPVPKEPLPNDDLDLQLVWLKMLEDMSFREPTFTDFAGYWMKYLNKFPWDEYGMCVRNLERGLRPPISGCYENGYIDNMGSPIRSEIWACIAPGMPQLAATLAYKDAVLDHAGGEGVYGEMFWAAVEAAAFVESDPKILIQIGLNMIPASSHIYRAIKEVLWCYENNIGWTDARAKVITLFSNPIKAREIPDTWGGYISPAYAAPNHGFTVMGWLYGKDFGDKLLKAVNCGYDTDCTGATLGSLLGIINGASAIPQEWETPVGESIKMHAFNVKFNYPKDITELTERTEIAAKNYLKNKTDFVNFEKDVIIKQGNLSSLFENDKAREILTFYEIDSAVETVNGLDICFHYRGEPVLLPGIEKQIGISVREGNIILKDAEIEIQVPESWKLKKEKNSIFKIYSEKIDDINKVKVRVNYKGKKYNTEFILFKSGENIGWPTGINVEYCPVCQARKGSCICQDSK